jgi:hypothetical protein
MRTFLHGIPTGLAAAYLLAALTGCSGDRTTAQVAAMNTSNIQRLANMYSAYQNYKGGSGPKDEADFKAFVKNFESAKLQMMGIDPSKLDNLFTSERDSKPFKIRYKIGGGKGSVSPVVFEQVGAEGTKQVAFTGNSKVEAVDDATYADLWAGKSMPVGGRPKFGRTGPPADTPKGPPGK